MREIEAHYNNEAQIYNQRYLERIHLVEDYIVSEQIKSIYKKGQKLLDIGCGTGAVIRWGDVDKKDYTGVDISGNMIVEASKAFNGWKFVQSDILLLKAPKVDRVVACYGQVNYIGLHNFTKLMDRFLKANGMFLWVMYANKNNPDVVTPKSLQEIYTKSEIYGAFSRDWEVDVKPFSCPIFTSDYKSQQSYMEAKTINIDHFPPKYFLVRGSRAS